MADLTLLRESPLAHLADAMADGSGAAVALREEPFLAMVALQLDADGPAADPVARVLGCPLPTSVGSASRSGGRTVLWLGPTEWLVVSGDDEPATLADALAAALGGAGSAVDVSANRTVLVLSGPAARWVLQTGCPADLHPRSFDVGRAVATTLGPVPLLLWQTESGYRLLPRSSFADYTARWLLDAMREHRG